MAVELRRTDEELWPAVQRAIQVHWQAAHPLLDPALFSWQYRGYGAAADGAPWAFVAIDGREVVSFLGLIPGMVRHLKADRVQTRPQALVALWFTAESYRSSAAGLLVLREAQRHLELLGSLGVSDLARRIFARVGFERVEDLARWVVPLGEGYERLLRHPGAVDGAALAGWLGRTAASVAAEPVALDPERLAVLAGNAPFSGLDRTSEFYAWRYGDSVGYRYQALRSEQGAAVVRVEEPALDGALPVLRIIELLPETEAVGLARSVIAWGRAAGCCAADYQGTDGDIIGPALAAAGFERYDPARPHTALAELFRPYRPDLAPINVVFHPDPDDVGQWRFLKSDGDMDRTNEPFAGG